MKREYKTKMPKYGDLIPVDKWKEYVDEGTIMEDDGNGCWAKDNMYSDCDAFDTPQEDATHVAWFNK